LFLKTLTLKGFKSFADTTSLDLEPGVTVVVGPNGSGKSNVVDAIGWVLGAQAPSSVRSQKMDDVIFAGTAKRSPLGRAEVSLTIDNSSGMLPIEFTEVTITRILFRSGDSEYAINGVPCRLLDIQELLSDSGVGRQQHVIISQGQIDAVLNARPEDRRAIVEEAAGVLKFRRRKEKSERRLAATEGNLNRLQDLLREVRRQLRPLERQADAARRHAGVVAELEQLRIHTAGRELAALRAQLERDAATRVDLERADRELHHRLSELDTSVMATESRLTAMGGDDLGDSLAQFESLYERARGLASLLAERRRGIDRDRNAFVDQGVIATLEAEAARVGDELRDVETEAAALEPSRAELVAAEAALESERGSYEAEWADGVAAPSSRAAEVRGELSALHASIERSEHELARVAGRAQVLAQAEERLAVEAERLRGELTEAEAAERPLVEALDGAEEWRSSAERARAAAEEARHAAEAELHAWQARREALALALDEARSRAGVERLSGTEGVLGTLAELIEIDEGWEAAFDAAAGEALAAVVVEHADAARRSLAALEGDELAGAVLALVDAAPAAHAAMPPTGADDLRRHVRARSGVPAAARVDALLDALLASTVVVAGGWHEAFDVALAHPRSVVVTTSGDRFTTAGWRIRAAGAGVTGAALDEAKARTEAAAAAAELAAERLAAAVRGVDEARQAEDELSRQLDANDGRMSAAGDGLTRVETERRDVATEAEAVQAHHADLSGRVERERARTTDLERELPELEAAEHETAERGRAMGEARSRLEQRAAEVGGLRTDLEVRGAGLGERREFLERRLAELDARLSGAAEQRAEAEARRVEIDRRQVATDALAVLVADRQAVIQVELDGLRERRRRQSEAARQVAAELDGLRRQRAEAERELSELRERQQRLEITDAETKLRVETTVEALRRDLDCEPDRALVTECPPLADGVTPAGRIRELERELRIMGPINPLALEEFEALQERHEFLQGQLDDVKESRRELGKIIKAIDAEIVNVFASAYADVAANFEQLFDTLFPGGRGRLRLTDPDNLLDTGIELEARPSGKNVRKLSLLSGGERSLTALAFLFAVFRSRPSPFYVMDEVEAALDDVNLHRFLGLVAEFRDDAQLIIVSHQKRTMEAADCLYGVTMQPGGSSRVVSERVGATA
jgi:chromosome segregation protein